VYQAHDGADNDSRHGFGRDRPEWGLSGERPLDGKTEKEKRKPEGIAATQHAGDKAKTGKGIREGDVSPALLFFVRMARNQYHDYCRHQVGNGIEKAGLYSGEVFAMAF